MADFLTIEEFAKEVNYSTRRIRQFCRDGRIKAQKLGDKTRKWQIPSSEVRRLKESSKQRITINAANNIQLEGHQRDMLQITKAMVANGLEYVNFRHIKEIDANIYTIPNVDSFVESDLSERLRYNFVKLPYNPQLVDYFCQHMKTGYPRVIKDRLQDAIDQNQYELIKVLRLITASRKIKGTCPVCKDLQL